MSRHSKGPWTPDEDDYLRLYYNDPDHSAASIGAHLKRSRNAVIGRAGRIGLATPSDAARANRVKGKDYKTPSLRKF